MHRPDVDGLLAELTPAQFDEWWACFELSNWGPDRDDLRSGLLACAIAIALNGETPWRPEQFVLAHRDEDESPEQGLELQAELLRGIAAAQGGA